jgi:uncharacterized membrane protein
MNVPQLLLIAVVFAILDLSYINLNYDMMNKLIKGIQGTDVRVRPASAVVCYIIMTGALYYFIISQKRSAMEAGILGAVINGIYETTNYAILSGWNEKMVVMDTIWGGVLFYLTTTIVYWSRV